MGPSWSCGLGSGLWWRHSWSLCSSFRGSLLAGHAADLPCRSCNRRLPFEARLHQADLCSLVGQEETRGGKQSEAVGRVLAVWSDLGREGRVHPRQSASIWLGPQSQSNQWWRHQFWLVVVLFV